MNERKWDWIKMTPDGLEGRVSVSGRPIDFRGRSRAGAGVALFDLFTDRLGSDVVGAVWEWPKDATGRTYSMVVATRESRVFARLIPEADHDQVQDYRIVALPAIGGG